MSNSIINDTENIMVDLTWIDILKGVAIIGVFFDNWRIYYKIYFPGWGTFVQVFFILSGFGLTLAYLNGKANWSWKRWAWRRITKIVVPYAIAVILSFVLGMTGSHLYPSIDIKFSWTSLLAYLTFTRNFYPTSWGWNDPLWFMPVIIGLYICFPILIKILEKWGPWVLLLISVFVTYVTITIAVLAGVHRGHGADLFSFWVIQFSLGIAFSHVRSMHPQKLYDLVSFKAFILGIGLFSFSWGVRTYLPLGRVYNDMFTSVGIFLILLNLSWISRLQVPATGKVLSILGRKSYLMYLVHYPIMAFLIGPPLKVFTNPTIGMTLVGIYIVAIFLLCYFISQPMDKFTSWLYRLFFPPYQRQI
jgi:peptidoglycan/LPS O-acetylase OafA/YrhL